MFPLIAIPEQSKTVTSLMGNIVLNQKEQKYLSNLINRVTPDCLEKTLAFFKKSKKLLPQRSDLTLKILDPSFSLWLFDKDNYINTLSPYAMSTLLIYDNIANEVFDVIIIPMIQQEKTSEEIDRALQTILTRFSKTTSPYGVGRSSVKRCFPLIVDNYFKTNGCEKKHNQKAPVGPCSFHNKTGFLQKNDNDNTAETLPLFNKHKFSQVTYK
jgi:hypothetical protein